MRKIISEKLGASDVRFYGPCHVRLSIDANFEILFSSISWDLSATSPKSQNSYRVFWPKSGCLLLISDRDIRRRSFQDTVDVALCVNIESSSSLKLSGVMWISDIIFTLLICWHDKLTFVFGVKSNNTKYVSNDKKKHVRTELNTIFDVFPKMSSKGKLLSNNKPLKIILQAKFHPKFIKYMPYF